MQRLEVNSVVRLIYKSLGVKVLKPEGSQRHLPGMFYVQNNFISSFESDRRFLLITKNMRCG